MVKFYYNRKKLRNWAIFNLFMLLIVLPMSAGCLSWLFFISIVKVIVLLSALAAFYVYMCPQVLAEIDKKGIKIDHNALLKWEDIKKAQKIKVRGCCLGRDIIRFELKEKAIYPLTFMQKISKSSVYGAFSIPLYAMTKEDAESIEKEIDNHLQKNPAKRLVNKLKEKIKKKVNKK